MRLAFKNTPLICGRISFSSTVVSRRVFTPRYALLSAWSFCSLSCIPGCLHPTPPVRSVSHAACRITSANLSDRSCTAGMLARCAWFCAQPGPSMLPTHASTSAAAAQEPHTRLAPARPPHAGAHGGTAQAPMPASRLAAATPSSSASAPGCGRRRPTWLRRGAGVPPHDATQTPSISQMPLAASAAGACAHGGLALPPSRHPTNTVFFFSRKLSRGIL